MQAVSRLVANEDLFLLLALLNLVITLQVQVQVQVQVLLAMSYWLSHQEKWYKVYTTVNAVMFAQSAHCRGTSYQLLL